MTVDRSACGIYNCPTCEHAAARECSGCMAGNRQLLDAGSKACEVFACVGSRGIAGCGDCEEASCVLRRSVEAICPIRSQFENKRWWAGRLSRTLEARKPSCKCEKEETVSTRVVNRLRWYLVALDRFAEEGAASVSSWQIAERVGVNAALIRKDLSRFGDFGTPSFGYRVDDLTQKVRAILGLDKPRGVVWIGAACFRLNAGAVERLGRHACDVTAVFDVDPGLVGLRIADHEVLPLERLEQVVSTMDVHTATICVPGPVAQMAANRLADLGVRALLNLSGELLVLPDSVKVTSFDLVGELLELSYYCGARAVDNKTVSG